MAHAELLDLARAVALEAAALVRRRRQDGVAVADTKTSPTDIVTAVDRAAEELIHRRLADARPGDGFL
ncbi:MAG TPA: inositol monophosphatase family protein, partial [Nocardioidaceae bacterium]